VQVSKTVLLHGQVRLSKGHSTRSRRIPQIADLQKVDKMADTEFHPSGESEGEQSEHGEQQGDESEDERATFVATGSKRKEEEQLDHESLEPYKVVGSKKVVIGSIHIDRHLKHGQLRKLNKARVTERLGAFRICPPALPIRCLLWKSPGVISYYHTLVAVEKYYALAGQHSVAALQAWKLTDPATFPEVFHRFFHLHFYAIA
jgi:hypothetical protein